MSIFTACDVETTGIEPGSRMIELAAVSFDETGAVRGTFQRLCNPGMPLPPDITAINGITPDMLQDAPHAVTVLDEFFAWLPADLVCVAHNAPYDCGVIAWDAARVGLTIPPGIRVMDTLALARSIAATKKNDLQVLVEHYGIDRIGEAHRAMSDADACRQYFMKVSGTAQLNAQPAQPWESFCTDYQYAYYLPDVLKGLPEMVANGADLSFTYTDAKGETTDRTITPYGWAMTKKGLMFHGYCHLRSERRSFYVDRMGAKAEAA